MNALRQLGFLKLNLRPDGGAAPDHDHRVIELFRNRAELKKAYGGLQEETYRLKDLVKQQEAATQRVQELLGELEARLGNNDTAYSTLTFYQLRRLWQSGRELLTQFVADLAKQQDERERRHHLALHNRRQFARRQAGESQVGAAQGLADEANSQVTALENERAGLTRFWHYFKRRALERRIHGAQAAAMAANATLAQARSDLEALNQEELPEFPGLSLEARRAINLAAIAYAEVLCARLQVIEQPLLTLAREATGRRSATDAYGTPKDCVMLMAQIQRAQRLLASRASLSEEIRSHTERLQEVVTYRVAADTCPTTESIGLTVEGGNTRGPNVLAEDTWDLFRVLLR
ncbi:MAG TPA: hypothetical protein VNX02_11890 [Steroidobacteraceae bacterium]|jgi:hypothetical protein|nr:hypothetical protein [Steroidobacteraceae bacterium]